MEICILILAFGFISYIILEIYENIQMNRWIRQRHLRELKLVMMHPEFFSRTYDVSADEIRRAMHAYAGDVEVIIEEEKTNETRDRIVG